MIREVGGPVLVLLGLATVGIALAAAGTAFGLADPLTDDRSGTEFHVGEEGVTVTDDDRTVTLIDDTSNVSSIELAETDDGRYEVSTERERPLTAAERERAIELAKANETVRQYLEDRDEYDISAEPIERLELEQRTLNVTVADETDDGFTLAVDEESAAEMERTGPGSVTIDREPTYVDDEATVTIRPAPAERAAYTVHVDLQSETVTGLTDWTAIRNGTDANAAGGDS